MTTPQVHTYHCTSCTVFLLASTYNFSTLPVRSSPGLDSATIIPFPSLVTNPNSSSSHSEPTADFTVLLGLVKDRDGSHGTSGGPGGSGGKVIVAREDGFEKRALYRCGRCKVVVAYAVEGKGWLYLLPEGWVETGRMEREAGERREE
ncbi:Similar to hypothetical protein HMPREF1120_02567 [Exophiala dermatitidis NIH/UT8656]; acc. no. EHY54398 [Pyronema omphalodes CBS 100304]|uniref:STEEP1 domain-containing protein n=1 Tax=Pyronema omphalodes (strain CBS 100304) TaxID=1076935 RepID=U4LAE5_PYROM|nr:Similar to hypothetical protein HMPREF1120_02567 [Exophiala dermatitidis NIH/UT8656]; acc. no. EHY54398 [Pyronema omphalodes CBS 100304]